MACAGVTVELILALSWISSGNQIRSRMGWKPNLKLRHTNLRQSRLGPGDEVSQLVTSESV